MQQINVSFYALFRDLTGKSNEVVQTPALSVGDLYKELKQKYNFPLTQCRLKVAINDEFSSFETLLKEGDKVVFIPPVAGG